MYASIASAVISGVSGNLMNVEVHTSSGFPGYNVVGMPDTHMRESKDRIRAAMLSSGLSWPQSRITINLAPSSVRKNGSGTELAVLVGLLCACKELDSKRFENAGIIGEVGLDGTIREVPGAIARVVALKAAGKTEIFVPTDNAPEAMLVDDVTIFPIDNVRGLIDCLTQGEPWPTPSTKQSVAKDISYGDYSEIVGQSMGCEAMMLLAAGGHHSLLMGSPGVGKTMLAERLPSILPELTNEESYIATAIQSIMQGCATHLIRHRAFRQPHHSASPIAMIGGGSTCAIPGEVTYAHKGILFLDELSEFSVATLEMLRQPLESGKVSLSRAQFKAVLPADFSLLACSNPCPCSQPKEKCTCSDITRQRYTKKLSGPLLDRFDIRLELYTSNYDKESKYCSTAMKDKVVCARDRQYKRNKFERGYENSRLTSSQLEEIAPLSKTVSTLFKEKVNARDLSWRGAVAIWRLARTIADLDDSEKINESHMSKAFDFRQEIS